MPDIAKIIFRVSMKFLLLDFLKKFPEFMFNFKQIRNYRKV